MKAVILGNGWSLQEHLERGDFDLLKQVDTFAMNLIDLLYDKTDWRPTNYIWIEQANQAGTIDRMQDIVEIHVRPKKEMCYIGVKFHSQLHRRFKNDFYTHSNDFRREKINYLHRCSNNTHGGQADEALTPTQWHLPMPCCYGGTMNTALQLAFMLGYTDVAVIGADLGYKNGSNNNFDPSYTARIDGKWALHNQTLERVHSMAREHYEKWGRRIVNAGIRGELKAYDRVDLQEWLNGDVL